MKKVRKVICSELFHYLLMLLREIVDVNCCCYRTLFFSIVFGGGLLMFHHPISPASAWLRRVSRVGVMQNNEVDPFKRVQFNREICFCFQIHRITQLSQESRSKRLDILELPASNRVNRTGVESTWHGPVQLACSGSQFGSCSSA